MLGMSPALAYASCTAQLMNRFVCLPRARRFSWEETLRNSFGHSFRTAGTAVDSANSRRNQDPQAASSSQAQQAPARDTQVHIRDYPVP
jgi:hypothetical protein